MNERIATLLYLLARELGEICKTPTSQCCSSYPATKHDLAMMEQRILAAIGTGGLSEEDKSTLDRVEAKLLATVKKFEHTDAQHP